MKLVGARAVVVGIALLVVGFVLGLIWGRGADVSRANADRDSPPEARLRANGSEERAREAPAERPLSAGDPPVVASAPATRLLVPDPGGGRAKVEFDFRSFPQKSWFGCLAVIEGAGLDGTRQRIARKPYVGGEVTFDVPAGRWRVTWKTSAQLGDQHGRILELAPDDHVRIDTETDTGDPITSWIWPGLGIVEVVVVAPNGKPLTGALVVFAGHALTAEGRMTAATDHKGRCRFEARPGHFEVHVGWARRDVVVKAGQVNEVTIGGRQTGTLVVSSARPQTSVIRLLGTDEWRCAHPDPRVRVSSDEVRFDLLPPGEYEIAVEPRRVSIATVAVRSGQETHLDLGARR